MKKAIFIIFIIFILLRIIDSMYAKHKQVVYELILKGEQISIYRYIDHSQECTVAMNDFTEKIIGVPDCKQL